MIKEGHKMETETGKRYRDRVTGVVGVAVDKMIDRSPVVVNGKSVEVETPQTQLKLDALHIEGHPDVDQGSDEAKAAPKAHQGRWYEDERLEDA
jgi:hypothetical protein